MELPGLFPSGGPHYKTHRGLRRGSAQDGTEEMVTRLQQLL
jgi:hypothetical protein